MYSPMIICNLRALPPEHEAEEVWVKCRSGYGSHYLFVDSGPSGRQGHHKLPGALKGQQCQQGEQ